MSLCWQTDINSSTGSKAKLSTNEILSVFPVFSFMNGEIKVQALLTFSLRPAEANCPREVPYRDVVSMKPSGASPSLEGRQQRPRHRGYGNVQRGWRTERPVFHPQLRRLARS
ncbi:hypothetical protein AMECASPLE_038966 [Ameca splendens]|uniref:Uncharacterized protein n=1 Tax=Ameca splendens TaxID=208324 RepID=A0ABV0Y879_9TELE